MKKSITVVVTVILFLALSLMTYSPVTLAKVGVNGMSDYGTPQIIYDDFTLAPKAMTGVLSAKLPANLDGVYSFFNQHKDIFKIGKAEQEFTLISSKDDKLGSTHIKVQQVVNGIPVFGNEYIVHFDQAAIIYSANGKYDPTARNARLPEQLLDEAAAITVAKSQIQFEQLEKDITTKLYLYKVGPDYVPVYDVRLSFSLPEPGDWHVFVNAIDGSIVNKYNGIKYADAATGTGVGVVGDTKSLNLAFSSPYFYLTDISKPMYSASTGNGYIKTYDAKNRRTLPGYAIYDIDNIFNSSTQAAGVDAHYYAGVVYDYYYNNFGRNSLDGQGMNVISTVHYSRNYNNAFWNGYQMVYGDGDGITFIPLSAALDVVAHEMTHGVTDNEVGLIYQDQSGALSESYSDIFGSLIEGQNWELGEVIYTPGIPGDALRSLSDPTLYGDPDNMVDYLYTTSDYGGVHTNCGIPNKAGYLIDQAIGDYKTGQIYYRSLLYLTSTAQFSDARLALSQAAIDLYGSNSVEYNAVQSAFDTVGIY